MGKMLTKLLGVAWLVAVCQHAAFAESPTIVERGDSKLATIVLILDDLGNSLALGQRAIHLPGAINYAILPQSPNGARLAKAAHQQGKEVMLHIPMSNIKGRRMGPGALTPAMDEEHFIATLRQHLQSIPYVRGVNNHMGSLLTQLHRPMSWFMKELKQQQLYFVDSRTSPLTVAESLAKTYNLPHLRRHVFLDNHRSEKAISKQFERLISIAKEQGTAVAIGHPHPETLGFLEQALPVLRLRGVRLAFASEVAGMRDNTCVESTIYQDTGLKKCMNFPQIATAVNEPETLF